MLHSIKTRFVLIYILLVIICMAIVGTFLIRRLETQQIRAVLEDMEGNLNALASSSDVFQQEDWVEEQERIQGLLRDWRLNSNEGIYAIGNKENPIIIGATVNSKEAITGKNALSNRSLDPELIVNGFKGESGENNRYGEDGQNTSKHLVRPILSRNGEVRGVLYMVTGLDSITGVVEDTKVILTYATVIGIFITSALGLIIAGSITGPIRDVTKKAKEMAMGNYRQKVEVKSDDEIGRLASMFNYLTSELESTIGKMDIERSKLDTIFHYMAEGVVALDRKGKLIHANTIARRLLDLPEGEGEEVFLDSAVLNIDVNYYDKSSLRGESRVAIKGNYYNVKYAPYKDETGKDTGLILVFQDVTKDHRLDVLRKEFVANVSHELKTPITTITSYAETLGDKDLPEEARERFIHQILRESDRMNRLVKDLLLLSDLDYPGNDREQQKINPYEAVAEVIESLYPMSREKSQHVVMNIPEDVKPLLADPHGLEQVLRNILSNAIKYTAPGGRIEVKGENFAGRVIIRVIDNGMGIPSSDIQRIFERFYRVEKGRSREKGGTGLGLSIAKEMMDAMGGKISVTSQLGEGTTVRLSFLSGGEEE